MAERFTGFYDDGEMVLTTLGPVELDELLERLRARLLDAEPGLNIRIDLISWRGEEEP